MVEVEGLTRVFRSRRSGEVTAVDGVSFRCHPGEIFGLLGRNGAGKTTTLRILATILTPTRGTARISGHDVRTEGGAVRRQLGFVTGDTRLYHRLSAREALSYFGGLQGLGEPGLKSRIAALGDRFDLTEFIDRRIGDLSTGQRQRITLARALLHDPPVLVLDEPTAGLDILAARETLRMITDLRSEGRTVILSTHILTEVERVCDRVGVLDHGRLLACAPLDEIRAAGDGDLEEAFVKMVEAR